MNFEEKILELKNIEGFQSYQIISWNSYKAIVEYYTNGTKSTKTFIDNGNNDWIEVTE